MKKTTEEDGDKDTKQLWFSMGKWSEKLSLSLAEEKGLVWNIGSLRHIIRCWWSGKWGSTQLLISDWIHGSRFIMFSRASLAAEIPQEEKKNKNINEFLIYHTSRGLTNIYFHTNIAGEEKLRCKLLKRRRKKLTITCKSLWLLKISLVTKRSCTANEVWLSSQRPSL